MSETTLEPSRDEAWKDKEYMIHLRDEIGLTYAEIADHVGCGESTAYKWMKKHRTKEMVGDIDVDIPDKKPYQDRECMKKLYVEKELSGTDISVIFDCSSATVSEYLRKHGIETRSLSEAQETATKGGDRPTFYTRADKGYEVSDSSETGIYIHRLQAVAYWGFEAVKDNHVHHINGIEWHNTEDNLMLIDPSEHMRHHHGNYNWLDELRAVEMYDEGASSYDVSRAIGCSAGTAIAWIHKNAPEIVRNQTGKA